MWGDDYLIGYQLTTNNSTVHSEHLSISKAMTSCLGEKNTSLILQRNPDESLTHLLHRHEESFLDYTSSQPYILKSDLTIGKESYHASESLTLPTRCYAVEFNDDFVTISLRK